MPKQNTVLVKDEYSHGMDEEVRSFALDDGTLIFIEGKEFYFMQNNRLMEPKEVVSYLRGLAKYSFTDSLRYSLGEHGLYTQAALSEYIPLHRDFGERIGLDPIWKKGMGDVTIWFGEQSDTFDQMEDWDLDDVDFQKDISKEKTIP